jgi:hypothetical protein
MKYTTTLVVSLIVVAASSGALSSEGSAAKQDQARDVGVVPFVLNRSYNSRIRVGKPYSQLVEVMGVDGRIVRQDERVTRYRWEGAANSHLDAEVKNGIVRRVMIVNPKGAVVVQSLVGNR